MAEKNRRSWLLVPASKPDHIAQASRSGADVIVLDFVELVAEAHKAAARDRARTAIVAARGGGAEVFAQTAPQSLDADLRACVWPGLSGVVVSRAESAGHIVEAAAQLSRLEEARGIPPGAVKIIGALETARGNHAAYDIASASPRVNGLTLGRADLVMDLRPEPSGDIHLMQYLMQRLIIVAGATGITPIGAWWRAPDRGLLATPENTHKAAQRGRAIGFKGTMCLRPDQVEPLNQAYA
jgi:citrate lyase subunit beta / citryl-CoA lyase